jgi:gluconolactonase
MFADIMARRREHAELMRRSLRQGGITTVSLGGSTSFKPSGDRSVTNIAFGGADLSDAWITLSRRGLIVKTWWNDPGFRLPFNA